MAFRSFATISVFVSAVLAQSASNPYIPSGISNGCSAFLTSLNNNAAFASCTAPFTTALAPFAPGATSPSVSSSVIGSLLGQLCNNTAFSACPQSTVTAQLSSFYAACENELTSSPNVQVKTLYDLLYSLVPLRLAICAKDDAGNYCAADLSTNSSGTGKVALADAGSSNTQSLLTQYLYVSPGAGLAATRRDASNVTALAPNTTTYQDTNLVFMFLEPSMSNQQLCTTCTRNILTPYITFESNCPYAPGINNSLLFAGQPALYNGVTSKCGSNFLSGAVQAAGGLSSGIVSGAAPRFGTQDLPAALSAILGAAALVAAAL